MIFKGVKGIESLSSIFHGLRRAKLELEMLEILGVLTSSCKGLFEGVVDQRGESCMTLRVASHAKCVSRFRRRERDAIC